MPKPAFKSVSDITSALLQPALTSHFLIEINTSVLGSEFTEFLGANGVNYNAENLNLMCSEASLPGSSLATLEITSDFTGVTERHAYRRIYDDRVDLTFYVDATNHMPIRFFESWIKYIVDESISEQSDKGAGSIDPNYFYRVRYPEEYNKASVTITKFERTSTKSVNTTNYESSYGNYTGNPLVYQFVNCYPISISSMPVSYDSSSLLKCSVSMTYVRYVLFKNDNIVGSSGSTPTQQAIFNTSSIPGLDYGNYTTTGGVSLPAASSSGNTVQTAFSGVTLL